MYENPKPQNTCKMPSERKWVKKLKNQFYVRHNHFGANQCPQVLGFAQDGERVAGAETISGQDPGSRPMRRRVENALDSENLPKLGKRG